jgi:hypothetical protein
MRNLRYFLFAVLSDDAYCALPTPVRMWLFTGWAQTIIARRKRAERRAAAR